MGGEFSRVSAVSDGVMALEKLCSEEHISTQDKFWANHIECLQFELDDYDPSEIENLIHTICEKMARNNVRSRNLNSMMRVLMQKIKSVGRKMAQTDSLAEDDNVALLNLLFLTRLFLKYFIEDMTHDKLVNHFIEHTREAHSKEVHSKNGDVAITVGRDNFPVSQIPHISHNQQTSSHHAGTGRDATSPHGFQDDFDDMSFPVEFMQCIIDAIIDFELHEGTYEVHVEFVATFLVMCSTQMYEPLQPGTRNLFLEAALHGSVARRAGEFIEVLVNRFIDRPTLNGVYTPQQHRKSVLQRVGGAVYSLITLPLKIYQYFFPPPSKEHPLSDHSALALLVVTHQRFDSYEEQVPSEEDEKLQPENPYQLALETFRDSDAEITDSSGSRLVSFSALHDALAACVNYEGDRRIQHYTRKWGTILLYSFLHGNAKFRDYLFSRSDVDVIVLPLLEKLYHEEDLSSNSTYMILIILLILSQDPAFCEIIHERLTVPHVEWYREAILHDISLGSLTMVVLLRTVSSNLSSIRDPYLLHNCLASLSNMSAYAHKIHRHAAQRLMNILQTLVKRYLKIVRREKAKGRGAVYSDVGVQLQQQQQGASQPYQPDVYVNGSVPQAPNSTTSTSTVDIHHSHHTEGDSQYNGGSQSSSVILEDGTVPIEVQSIPTDETVSFQHKMGDQQVGDMKSEISGDEGFGDDATTFSDFIHLILEITNSSLRPKLVPSNIDLIYCLLHGRDVLKPLRKHGQFWDLVQSLDHLVNYFDIALRQANLSDMSVDNVLMVFEKVSRNYETTEFARHREVILQPQFTYEERANSSEFFLPYIWSVVFYCAGILWNSNDIVLFTPKPLQELENDGFPDFVENEQEAYETVASTTSTENHKNYVQNVTTNSNGEVEISVELP